MSDRVESIFASTRERTDADGAAARLAARYRSVRRATEYLCEPLENEDYGVQSMPDASPAKWHLAHTSWFFETFVLLPSQPGYRPFDPRYEMLFNSYYNAVGRPFPRAQRGLLSRPTVAEVYRYRRRIDDEIETLLAGNTTQMVPVIELGLHHEQQHQELILTDLKHLFSCNPMRPVYRPFPARESSAAPALQWVDGEGGLHEIGHHDGGFAFDNEGPRHRVFVEPFQVASRLVTNGEYLAFIAAGGYARPELWLSDGWDTLRAHGWEAPFYWERDGAQWMIFTLGGVRALDPAEPVCHVSYYEADAYARWAGVRLPCEAEWEMVAAPAPVAGNFVEADHLHPQPAGAHGTLGGAAQLFGDVWEWTQSPYTPYPGYHPPDGALGEYNAKFMSSQLVLRGGSCVSPQSHLRATYRNFFPPAARWQFMGIRLARDARSV